MRTLAALLLTAGVVILSMTWPGTVPGGRLPFAAAQGAVPPGIDGRPPTAAPYDSGPVRRDGDCVTTTASAALGAGGGAGAGAASGVDLEALWRITRGAGQEVALIDTGVNPGPRLPRLRGIGDYVGDSDGLEDCDAHGTLAAGIIAATDEGDGATGLAPGVGILSVRQSSSVYRDETRPPGPDDDPGAHDEDVADEATSGGVGTLSTLARAVRAAADSGAGVVNISQVACVPAGTPLADETLGAALRYAVVDRDVVVVAAAGNVGAECGEQNSDGLLAPRNAWAGVHTVATPAWYEGPVLTVGAVDAGGAPAPFSLRGPWVDVAAPGTDLVTVGSDASGSADRVVHRDGSTAPIEGTSFAAPFVAATAALVRAAHPALTARQVADRIRFSALPAARGHDQAVGHGIVDPLSAVAAVAPVDKPGGVSGPLVREHVEAGEDEPGRGGVITAVAVMTGLLTLAFAGLRRVLTRPPGRAPV